jgi:hypothetical protein
MDKTDGQAEPRREDFEEVIALYGEPNPSCLLLMWRDAGAVFV